MSAAWDAAFAEYRRTELNLSKALVAQDEIEMASPDRPTAASDLADAFVSEAAGASCRATNALIATPAPTTDALIAKIEIAFEYADFPARHIMDALIADVRGFSRNDAAHTEGAA